MKRDNIDKLLFGLCIHVILFSTSHSSNSLYCIVIPNHDCDEKAGDPIMYEHKPVEIFTSFTPPKEKRIKIYLLKDCNIDGQVATKSTMEAKNDVCILKNCNTEVEAPYVKHASHLNYKASKNDFSS